MSYTMIAGNGNEELAGWAYSQSIKGEASTTFIPGCSRASAVHIASKKTGINWVRGYVVTNGQKVVLA